MQEINLVFTLAEVNQILEALGQQPYKDVFPLVNKIQQQAQAQLNQQQVAVDVSGPTAE